MAEARKCDRCRVFYLENEEYHIERPSVKGHKVFKLITEGRELGDFINKYDLCPECANKFFDFMNPFG